MKERIAQLRLMGIRTVMITGDNPLTAAAIAAEAGVDDFLAQATPKDKLEYIRKEQAAGRLVAMTGDGTNDAPALAQADVGLAMNTGTMAAKEAGIDVITTMNIQHLESLSDQVRQITGIRVRETIPDWVVHLADEVVIVDVTPRALLHRLERGVVYAPEKARSAMQNFFRESTLAALREMAFREAAHEVQHRSTLILLLARPGPDPTLI